MRVHRLLAATALTAFAVPIGAASAQDTSVTQAQDPSTLGQSEVELESGQEASEDDAIIVTGSRIRRPNDQSAVPITSVGVQELTDSGNVSLGDELNTLPALRSTFSQANSTRFIGTAGLNLLDLRGLGTERTLVLVNGRRHVSSTPGSYDVDVNTIPTDLLDRVDLVTGGNSAIYGSDAVAGVVNFVLKRDFEGFRLRGQGGISERGDRGSYFVSLTAGQNFAENRGNIAVALEYARSNPLFHAQRDDLTGALTGTFGYGTVDVDIQCADPDGDGVPNPGTIPFCDPNVRNGSDGIPDTRFFSYQGRGFLSNGFSAGGTITAVCPPLPATGTPNAALLARRAANCTGGISPTGGQLAFGYVFLPDGRLVRNDRIEDFRPLGGAVIGGLGLTGAETNILQPGLDRYAANILASFDVSPAFQPFLEAKYVRVDALQAGQATFTSGGGTTSTFRTDNAFLTDQARQTLATILAPGSTTFGAVRINNDFGPRGEEHRRETYRIVAGVGGDITDTLRYEIAGNFGRTETYYETNGNILSANFNRAVDAVRETTGASAGQIVCRINSSFDRIPAGQPNAGAINSANDDPACVPLDIFGANRFSQAALDYIAVVSSREQWAEQINATAFISGDTSSFFNLPGGGIGFAIGGEYRKERAFSAFDEVTQSGVTFLNAILTFDPPAQEIKEVFGELLVPIMANQPFFEELTVQASGRASDYGGNVGTQYAYNVQGIYSPIPDIRLRAGFARSVRAPNLTNLFATRSQTFVNGFVDPCNQNVINTNPNRAANCAAAGIPTTIVVNGESRPYTNTSASGISGFNQGNPELQPEVGDSFTVGGVFQPRFVPGLTVSVDYYNIRIRDVIQGLNGQTIINQCYDDPGGLDNQFCAVVFRRSDPDPLINGTFAGQSSRTLVGAETIPLPVIGPSFLNQPFNFAALRTSGIDIDVAYRRELTDDITLNLRAVASWVENRENFSFITEPDRSTRLHGTLGDPIWSGTLNANLDFGNFDLTYNARYLDKQAIAAWETQFTHQGRGPTNADAFPKRNHSAVMYHAFRLGIQPEEDRMSFYIGVDNLFDRYPPGALDGTGAGGGIYPNTGRFFYAGAEVTF